MQEASNSSQTQSLLMLQLYLITGNFTYLDVCFYEFLNDKLEKSGNNP